MRAGLSTIQQTLTPEASTVLNNSIAEAGRRNHGQTTPLHVASTLLSSPTGFLRQACIRSHPNSSHPLQCRALELCFSVALERLPTATSSPAVTEPPISNALMAALKRAQAHQRRGCPEQQQQPLLAVKVELEQLIISILDDPSVSRVMREASFSSPAVKATIEQSLTSGNNQIPSGIGIGFGNSNLPNPSPVPVNRNLYLNPRLQNNNNNNQNNETAGSKNIYLNPRLQGSQNMIPLSNNTPRNEDVKKVIEIMTKPKKRNPILVGESEPEAIRKEILKQIEKGEFELKNTEVISIEKEFVSISDKSLIPSKIKDLGDVIDKRIGDFDSSKGVVIDLGDLKWLVEQAPVATVSSVGRESVAEMSKIVSKFAGKVWLIGTATCETYLRCQVYHPLMETDWDLQAVPITSRSPPPNMFTRMGTNGILGSSIESLNPLKNFANPVTLKAPCCPSCASECEKEVAKLKELEKPPDEVKSSLPQWLQNAKPKDQAQVKDQEMDIKQKIQDLQKKWNDNCLRLHPNYNQSPRLDRVVPMAMSVPLTGGYKPNMLLRQNPPGQQPRLQAPRTLQEALQSSQQPRFQPPRSLQEALQSSQQPRLQPPRSLQEALQPAQQPRLEPPRSPVGTDLALGPKKNEDLAVKDLLGCISSEPLKGKFANSADTDSFKKLLKGLMKKAWWQPEAASTIATTITQCKVDTGSRGSVWLLFAGPDRVGKKKMCSVLAEHVCGANPITINLGSRRDVEETDMGFRGKTVLDRIVEAVRRNPSSVIVLSDIDEADMLVRGSIKRAMERGRITDSHGREISLGNVVFVLTGNWSTVNSDEHRVDEQRLHSLASSDWQLMLTASKNRKRRAHWLSGKDMSSKPRLDLNLAMDYDEDRTDGSINSSNLTIDQEEENQHFAVTSVPHELVGPSDGAVVFKPVNFGNIRREIEKTIKTAFSTIVDENITIEVEESAIENILGGLWFGRTSLEEWAEQVLLPSFHQFNARVPSPGEDMVVRLESDRDSVQAGGGGDWLPSKIAVVVEGVGS
ncbi:Double Clp-N motif-containing protein [Artemisia annua]|uniref:Double Clp-N motif-containing protein n=1 Tax=Artemisia annua TaxID=35608 RepID=A0A2U1NM89_ARTAN|nr:Double Clp-N motif-containing protein [Artemisia annua]